MIGQLPDAHTFTILLRGLADHPQYSSAVRRAKDLYHSMQKANSPVKPSIIHTNAMLKVCARHKDMDTLWNVLEKVPDMGPNSPDAWTWTSILNAMREEIIIRPLAEEGNPSKNEVMQTENEKDSQQQAISKDEQQEDADNEDEMVNGGPRNLHEQIKREQTILQARRLWGGIIQRWRRGILHMDAQLVQSMGMILLASSQPRNWDDVFSLVEQTMGIPRMIPKLTSSSSSSGSSKKVSPGIATWKTSPPKGQRRPWDEKDQIEGHLNPGTPSPEAYGPEFDARIGDSPSPSSFSSSSSSTTTAETDTAAYAIPTQATLSMLLEASRLLRNNKAATGYWNYLTNSSSSTQESQHPSPPPPHPDQRRRGISDNIEMKKILPDANNYHTYLRVLRLMRSSFKAVSLLEEMVSKSQERTRGGRRAVSISPVPKTFLITMSVCARDKRNPSQLIHANRVLSLMSSSLADPDIATIQRYFDLMESQKDEDVLRDGLERLFPIVMNLRGMLIYGRAGDARKVGERMRDAAMVLLRRILGAYGRLLGRRDEMRRRENGRLLRQMRELRGWVDRVEGGNSRRTERTVVRSNVL
ncbi:MAG: hypothetical protein M1823_002377 [Watsoniomyces obsoletus]|nr:MAG: hypothetical protein M1823_002377 [Watsoniomyces obsoletus]